MRRLALLAVLLPVLTACGMAPGGVGEASCVGPYLSGLPPSGPFRGAAPTVRPGGRLTVYGHWYTTTCHDAGGPGSGVGLGPYTPMHPVRLTLRLPGAEPVGLGLFSPAGRDVGFRTVVQVPRDAHRGLATITDSGGRTFGFRVR